MPDETVVVAEQDQQAESTAQAVETEQAAASAAAETTETQTDQKPPEKGGVQRRIDELTKARRLAEAEAEFWKAKVTGAAPAKEVVADKPKPKPVPGDFETTEAYLDARDEWVREDTLRVAREEFHKTLQEEGQKRERQSEQEILADEWGEKESAVEKEHPDYADVTAAAFEAIDSSKGPAKAALAHAIQYSEAGPEILYYLGQHPEEVQRLAGLHPTQAVIALGRIEARLAGDNPGGEKTNPPQTRAPKPPTPIKKASAADDGELRDDLSPEVWRSRFLKKLEKK